MVGSVENDEDKAKGVRSKIEDGYRNSKVDFRILILKALFM